MISGSLKICSSHNSRAVSEYDKHISWLARFAEFVIAVKVYLDWIYCHHLAGMVLTIQVHKSQWL